jgi:hypothetical protein
LGSLLDAASSGNKAALAGLLKRQATAVGPDLAMAVNTWWQGLSKAMQQELIAADPAAVGALDGLPAVARDQAKPDRLPHRSRPGEGGDSQAAAADPR